MDNQPDKLMDNCHTCWPSVDPVTGKNIIKCVDTIDTEKVVRTYMHPTDDIQETLWLFEAKIKCFSNYSIPRKFEESNMLKTFTNSTMKYSKIQYEHLP